MDCGDGTASPPHRSPLSRSSNLFDFKRASVHRGNVERPEVEFLVSSHHYFYPRNVLVRYPPHAFMSTEGLLLWRDNSNGQLYFWVIHAHVANTIFPDTQHSKQTTASICKRAHNFAEKRCCPDDNNPPRLTPPVGLLEMERRCWRAGDVLFSFSHSNSVPATCFPPILIETRSLCSPEAGGCGDTTAYRLRISLWTNFMPLTTKRRGGRCDEDISRACAICKRVSVQLYGKARLTRTPRSPVACL